MSLRSKWLDGVGAKNPVCDVAHRALRERLPIVFYYLPLAAWHYEDDVEFIHQLRVSSRRAVSVLQTLKPTLPKSRRRRVYRRLEHIRRAAGPARELDVLAERLQNQRLKIAGDGNSAGRLHISSDKLTIILELLAARRAKAQIPVRTAYERQRKQGLESDAHSLMTAIRWRGDGKQPSWGEVAPQLLKPAVQKMIQRSYVTEQPDDLHRFRIACKKFRYRMELTAGVFDPSFRESVYPLIRDIQQRLGAINDHVSAAELLEGLANKRQSAEHFDVVEELRRREQQTALELGDEFRRWWTASRAQTFRDELQSRFALERSSLPS